MFKKTSVGKLWLTVGLIAVMAMPATNAFARGRGRGRSHHEVVMVDHHRYHYRGGRFYRPGWFGLEFSVFSPPIGAIVRVLPFGYRTIVVAGAPYYYYDNVYYRSCPAGYIVVAQPVITPGVVVAPPVVATEPLPQETITINVPNANGSYTSVKLVRRDNGYVGPQGEFYPGHPTVDQLKALYGK